jgi:hypothetical protein
MSSLSIIRNNLHARQSTGMYLLAMPNYVTAIILLAIALAILVADIIDHWRRWLRYRDEMRQIEQLEAQDRHSLLRPK